MSPSPTLSTLLLIASSVGLSAAAQLLLKMGAGTRAAAGVESRLVGFATSPFILGGFALYGLGAVLWIFVLTRLPLSVAYPFVGVGFVLTMVLGGWVLGEALSPLRVAGTLLVLAGCTLVALSAGRPV